MTRDYFRGLSADTGLVCLLLAAELVRAAGSSAMEAGLLAVALAVASAVPYFLTGGEVTVRRWTVSRVVIAAAGLTLGAVISEPAQFVPMSLLIAAVFFSCAIQFYSLLKLHPAD
jgi:hypothetical protein